MCYCSSQTDIASEIGSPRREGYILRTRFNSSRRSYSDNLQKMLSHSTRASADLNHRHHASSILIRPESIAPKRPQSSPDRKHRHRASSILVRPESIATMQRSILIRPESSPPCPLILVRHPSGIITSVYSSILNRPESSH
jgi:hypothetical protein